jgi:predicted transcriptional regulator
MDGPGKGRTRRVEPDERVADVRGTINVSVPKKLPRAGVGEDHGNLEPDPSLGPPMSSGSCVRPHVPPNRPDIYVVHRILSALLQHGPLSPTNLERDSRTNHAQFRVYSTLLSECGLVQVRQDPSRSRLFYLTNSGYDTERLIEGALLSLSAGVTSAPGRSHPSAFRGEFAQP